MKKYVNGTKEERGISSYINDDEKTEEKTVRFTRIVHSNFSSFFNVNKTIKNDKADRANKIRFY